MASSGLAPAAPCPSCVGSLELDAVHEVLEYRGNHHFIELIFLGKERLDCIRDAKDAGLYSQAYHKVYNKLLYGNLSCEASP